MLTHLKTSFKFEHSRTLTGVQWLGWAVYVAEVDRQMCVQHMWWMACFSNMVITMHPRTSWVKCASFFYIYICFCFSLVFVLSEFVFDALYLSVALRGKIQIGKLWFCPTKSWVAAHSPASP